eukprot:TRINITY_DN2463_c0_g1_i2.p1 TRINITY_DN2463_c0_g1~~TRINITY_DN2463_c0_g1_i2.p1  ORF type:complete len:185 (-),score=41.38 TRINITY_DN2463_c0_g1_i2:1-555(-)
MMCQHVSEVKKLRNVNAPSSRNGAAGTREGGGSTCDINTMETSPKAVYRVANKSAKVLSRVAPPTKETSRLNRFLSTRIQDLEAELKKTRKEKSEQGKSLGAELEELKLEKADNKANLLKELSELHALELAAQKGVVKAHEETLAKNEQGWADELRRNEELLESQREEFRKHREEMTKQHEKEK